MRKKLQEHAYLIHILYVTIYGPRFVPSNVEPSMEYKVFFPNSLYLLYLKVRKEIVVSPIAPKSKQIVFLIFDLRISPN